MRYADASPRQAPGGGQGTDVHDIAIVAQYPHRYPHDRSLSAVIDLLTAVAEDLRALDDHANADQLVAAREAVLTVALGRPRGAR